MQSSPSPPKKDTLPFITILLGLFAIYAGLSDALSHWSVLQADARICDVLILAAGVILTAAGGCRLMRLGRPRILALQGAAGAGLFSGTLLAGVWSGAIPCSGPT